MGLKLFTKENLDLFANMIGSICITLFVLGVVAGLIAMVVYFVSHNERQKADEELLAMNENLLDKLSEASIELTKLKQENARKIEEIKAKDATIEELKSEKNGISKDFEFLFNRLSELGDNKFLKQWRLHNR